MGSPRTRKGTATRQRLLDTAVRLFASTGYDAVTMRAIAREAGVSTGLAYRYFDGKEALVAELYARLAQAFVDGVALPDGSWSDRGLHALDTSLRVLAPHRDALAALMGAAAAKPGLSPPLARTARQVEAVFIDAVVGSHRPPSRPEFVGELLYLCHLAVLLFWVLDQSDRQRATVQLREWVAGAIPLLSMALALPGVRRPVAALVDIVRLGVLGRDPSTPDDRLQTA